MDTIVVALKDSQLAGEVSLQLKRELLPDATPEGRVRNIFTFRTESGREDLAILDNLQAVDLVYRFFS